MAGFASRVRAASTDFAGEGARATRAWLVEAVQHVRRMRGGAQGHLMRCSDGQFYVVKFRNNPQHLASADE